MRGVKPQTRGGRKCPVELGWARLPLAPTQSFQVTRWHWPLSPQSDSSVLRLIWIIKPPVCRHQPPPHQSPPPLRIILKMFIVFVIDHNLHNIWGESIYKNTAVQSDTHEGESPKKIILRDRNVSLTFIWSVRGNFHTTSQCVLTTLTSRMMNSTSAWSLFYKHPSQ